MVGKKVCLLQPFAYKRLHGKWQILREWNDFGFQLVVVLMVGCYQYEKHARKNQGFLCSIFWRSFILSKSCIMKFRCIFREDCMKLFWETTYKVNHGRHYPRIVAHRSISARSWFQVQINVFPSIRELEHHVVSVILLPILLTTWIIPLPWCCLAVDKTVSIAKYTFLFLQNCIFLLKREFYNVALFTPGWP